MSYDQPTWESLSRNAAGSGTEDRGSDWTYRPVVASPTRMDQTHLLPIGSMYAIYGNIYHQYIPNDSIYTIHGSYGLVATEE